MNLRGSLVKSKKREQQELGDIAEAWLVSHGFRVSHDEEERTYLIESKDGRFRHTLQRKFFTPMHVLYLLKETDALHEYAADIMERNEI